MSVTVPLDAAASNAIATGFSGWHSMADDGTYKTTAAIACNGLKTRIINSFGGGAVLLSPMADSSLDVFHRTVYKGHSSASNISSDRRMALFKPAVVWITGPAAMSVPTLCALENYITPLPLYAVIRHKATTFLNQELKTFFASKVHNWAAGLGEYVRSDCVALQRMSITGEQPSYFADIVEDIVHVKDCPNQRATAVACMLHAMAVQHMCDIDAGAKFRDKRGRQAAFDELTQTAKTLLYAT